MHADPPPVLDYQPPDPERREWLRRRRWKIVAVLAILGFLACVMMASAFGRLPGRRPLGFAFQVLAAAAMVVFTVADSQRPKR